MNEAVRVEATAAVAPAPPRSRRLPASAPAALAPARKQSSVLQHAVYVIGDQ